MNNNRTRQRKENAMSVFQPHNADQRKMRAPAFASRVSEEIAYVDLVGARQGWELLNAEVDAILGYNLGDIEESSYADLIEDPSI